MGEIRESVVLENRGQKIFSILHLPDLSFPLQFPAVLFTHGFGGNKSGKFRLFVRLAELLADAGIAVLRFDFRGAGDSEGDFQDTTIEGMVEDTTICLEWLRAHPKIDPERIGMVGRSLGGLIAVLTAARTSVIKTLVLWAAVFDAVPWVEKGIGVHIPFQHQGVFLKDTFLTQFRALQMGKIVKLLDKIPLFHIQASRDKSVEQYHVDRYVEARRTADAETQFLVLPNSDHEFSDVEEQGVVLQQTVNWLKRNL